MIKKPVIFFALLMVTFVTANAQYYYKDLISNRQAIEEKVELKNQKVRNIIVHSFEGNGEPSEGFFCEKKISKDFKKIETYTRAYTTGKSLLTSYYNEKGQLLQSRDSSETSVAVSTYQYDASGNITSIVSDSYSSDDDFATSLKEEHEYKYNDASKPLQMLRIKNNKDSALIDFLLDEHGNVTDEIEPGANGRHYYYYYDTKNRMTDIVKFNVVKKKLVADFTFEYNYEGQVTQMIAVDEGVNDNYYTWKYTYNDGVRIIEKCFSKEKSLLGYFEYEYK